RDGPRAERFERSLAECPEQRLRHLRPGAIVRAEKEHPAHHQSLVSSPPASRLLDSSTPRLFSARTKALTTLPPLASKRAYADSSQVGESPPQQLAPLARLSAISRGS